jgi:trk system potassium uptake protein TrkH
MPENTLSLMYAIRFSVVCKYVAQLVLVQAGLIFIPFCLALFYAEYALALRFFTMSCLLMLIALPFLRLPVPTHVQTNEALIITVIAFLVGAAAMVYPFMGVGISFLDALFEAISGITTTGLSTITELENKPNSFLFARAWMQWYGGLEFVVLAITLVMGKQSVNRRLLGQEIEHDNIIIGIRSHARQVTLVYLILTITPIILLIFCGVDGFIAIVHVLSAVSTGGFSSFNDNLAGFDSWPIQLFLSCVGLLGAVSLALYYHLYQYGFSKQMSFTETLALLLMVISTCTILALILFLNGSMDGVTSIQQALLLAMSAQTTT